MKILKDYFKSKIFKFSLSFLIIIVPFILIAITSSFENFGWAILYVVTSSAIVLPFSIWYDEKSRSGK